MFHVLIPVSLNDSLTSHPGKRALRKKPMSLQLLTFSRLIEVMKQRSNIEGKPPQALNNKMSALRGFMADHAFSDDCPVGSDMRASYYRRVGEHVTNLIQKGKSTRYIANRKNLLGHWHSLVLELDRISATELGALSPFQKNLKELTAKAPSQMRLAADTGIPLATLKRWLSGATPQEKAIPMLRRLESYFGLAPGVLVELARGRIHNSPSTVGAPQPIAYRERMSKNTLRYVLKNVSDTFKAEWLSLVEYKTSLLPMLERQNNGRWASTEHSSVRECEKLWFCFQDGRYVPTAGLNWMLIAQYLGWLSLSSGQGGAVIPKEAAQTLGWLLVPARLNSYMTWRIKRSEGIVHSGVMKFLKIIKGLTHPVTGYLTQSSHLASALPPEAGVTVHWGEACAKTFAWSKKTLSILAPSVKNSREPFEPVKAVLELAEPMEAVSDMVQRMKSVRPVTGGATEAVWCRDLVLIKLLASNPLRAKNLKLLTYFPDNTGNLYQTSDGAWRIHILPELFKNQNGAAKNKAYDMPVDKSGWGDIERYLKRYRPLLPHAEQLPFVFISSEESETPGPWESLNRRVFALTKQYLWRCPGAGPHVFRYIKGTAILKASPGEWDTAAQVLHDRVETVRKHYAHLRGADGAERAHFLLHKSFARM